MFHDVSDCFGGKIHKIDWDIFRLYCRCGGRLIVVHRDVCWTVVTVCMRWPGFWDVGVLLFVVYPFPVCSLHFGFLSSNLITGRYLSSVRVYCSIDAVQYVRDPDFTYTPLVIWYSTIIAPAELRIYCPSSVSW